MFKEIYMTANVTVNADNSVVSTVSNETLEKMKKLLEMHIPEYNKALERITDIKHKMKEYRKTFKKYNIEIDYELFKRRKVIMTIDENIFFKNLTYRNAPKFENEIKEYLRLKKELLIRENNLPFSPEMTKEFNTLTQFEKSYLMYLIDLKNALWNYMYDSKNVSAVLEKSKEYESLKSSIYEIVFKQLGKF